MATPTLNFDNLTDQDLDDLSVITEVDILATHQIIVGAMNPQYKNLIVADSEALELETVENINDA